MDRRGVASIAIIVIVIILLLAISGVFYYASNQTMPPPSVLPATPPQYQSVPTSTPSSPNSATTQLDASNWQTYHNSDYGFEFKYPQEFRVSDDGSSLDWPENAGHYRWTIEPNSYKNINDWLGAWRVKIEKPHVYEGVALIQNKVLSVEDINIGGVVGKKILLSDGFPSWNTYAAFIVDDNLYQFGYDGWLRDSERKIVDNIFATAPSSTRIVTANVQTEKFRVYHRAIFNQILTTFKFVPNTP